MKPMLEAQDLTVSFGGIRAVDGVSFTAAPNEITTVIGPNGAGKSTLFNLISGSLRAHRGDVVVDGIRRDHMRPDRLRELGIGRSFQITNLFFELTVAENLRLAAQLLEPRGRWLVPVRLSTIARRRVEELLEEFQLAGKADERAGDLSHGEQRRLEIAVALATRPRVLMLDEPTQGMSHGDTAETARLIRALSDSVTVLLIEHDIGLVMDISDRIVVMHQGRKLADGPPADVRADPAVQAAYFGHSRS
ncbi:MAG: ABC transporter ATP-binding protein [Rhizobiaceae bacterium]|nr:ABC transporter ATP-binding protein [Rhizobiaceae bacterium]